MKRTAMRITALFLAAVLCLACVGCNNDELTQQQFDEYLSTLPAEFVSGDSININYTFYDPAAYGIEEELLTLPFSTREDWDESMVQAQEIRDRLAAFNENALDASSRLTRQVLIDYLDRQLAMKDFFLLDNSYLGSYLGFQAQLPLLLAEFEFSDKQDLDSYFNLLEGSTEAFHNYAEMEALRQENSVGMSQEILDGTIEQCENFSSDENCFLIEVMGEKIDTLDFLTDEEKAQAKQRNETLLKTVFLPAYKTLGEELSALTGRTENLGLAAVPGGKDYYEALLWSRVGVDMSMEEVQDYLQTKLQTYLLTYIRMVQENPELENGTSGYGGFTSAEQVLDYLGEEIKTDFPEVPGLSYEIKPVADAMKDNFSPAAYLTMRVDQPQEKPGSIYINGEYQPSLFSTLAHEGYPGHMYQDAYFHTLKLPAVRYLVDCTGYTEGWATYVEWNCADYLTGTDAEYLEFEQVFSRVLACILSLGDIGIHYEGWNVEEFGDFLKQYLSIPEETIEAQYTLQVEDPANYLCYYLAGMLFEDMRADAQQQLGNDFSAKEFHQVILDCGPTSIKIVQQQMEAYLKACAALDDAA